MAKTVVIFGATGKQGGSVVDAFLRDPAFKVRAVLRNPDTPAAQALQARGIEVVKGNLFDEASLVQAFKVSNLTSSILSFLRKLTFNSLLGYQHCLRCHSGLVSLKAPTLCISTNKFSGVLLPQLRKEGVESIIEEAYRLEKIEGKNLVNAVAANQDTIELFIFSSLSAANKISGGKFKTIYHFDCKAEIINYLETNFPELVSKTVELQLGMFATNILLHKPLRPTKAGSTVVRLALPANQPHSNQMADTVS